MTPEFNSFGKVPRLYRPVIVTEKIDGTNAQVYIEQSDVPMYGVEGSPCVATVEAVELLGETGQPVYLNLYAGSRTRWVTPGKQTDNHGWAAWVQENAAELVDLGPGRHFGEWWGKGINRGYGLEDKRFSLFNVSKWADPLVRPACCEVVPVLVEAQDDMLWAATRASRILRRHGSYAAPGYDKPEGLVVFHVASSHLYKVTLENDAAPKSKVAAS